MTDLNEITVIRDEAHLEDLMTEPSPQLTKALEAVPGDILILGVGGKMGPTLARLAKRASEAAGAKRRIIGVARFSDPHQWEALEKAGVEPLVADLLKREEVESLTECPNVIFMAGMKFGTTGAQARTWAINALAPGYVAERFAQSRIAVFSTGNVYPFTPVASGGPAEDCPPVPVGEYAQSALARERIIEYFSQEQGTPVAILRLNYAIDLRYGVLLDIATQVWEGTPVDLSMGHVNVIWQGDANAWMLRSLAHCSSPPIVLNVTGPETLSVRMLAQEFGKLLGKTPVFAGAESDTALLSNAAKAGALFGPPRVSVETMVRWVADWVKKGGPTFGKPTHFEARDGSF